MTATADGDGLALGPGVTLTELAAAWPGAQVHGPGQTVVRAITHDSRRIPALVQAGAAPSPAGGGPLFCCVRGALADGHAFAPLATAAGATAVLVDHRLALDPGVAQLVVDDVRRAMGPLSARVYGQPSEAVSVIGVTGTNGKTSVVALIGQILTHLGAPVRTIGTLTGARTTPEAPDLQASLAAARDASIPTVAMEVSSHALRLHRVDGTRFGVAVFTNLGHDHLDFHVDLADYEAAKTRLFSSAFTDVAVVNTDDPVGVRIARQCDMEVRPYGLASVEALRFVGTTSHFRWQGQSIRLGLPGVHNVLNAVAAALSLAELGYAPADIADALSHATPVRGRFELVATGEPYTVVVDFAHKPEALARVIETCRSLAGSARVLVVVGCGGDRDRSKRPLMGEIAATHSDLAIFTADNPRSEDPEAILDAMMAGVPTSREVRRILDRRRAIGSALDAARPGDVVLVAGKGDERHQIIGDTVVPFDDRLVVLEHLAARRQGSEATR